MPCGGRKLLSALGRAVHRLQQEAIRCARELLVLVVADLDFFGDALVLTVGGDYRFTSGWRLDLAVSEDIAVESASDVVFVIGVKKGLGTGY